MSRNAAPGDFQVQVEGLGAFTFGRRTMRDEFAIAAEYSRLTEGIETPTDTLRFFATAFSAVKVLLVLAPGNWDIETIDPLEDASYTQMSSVFSALCVAEADFRKKA